MMTEFENDILRNERLKENPFIVPEGYFTTLKDTVVKYPRSELVPRKENRNIFITLLSMAAMFVAIVTAGTFFLSKATPEETYSQEDFLVFSNNITDEMLYETYADAEIMEDDIIEYLIYSGESVESIEIYIK